MRSQFPMAELDSLSVRDLRAVVTLAERLGKAQTSMARCLIGLGRYDEAKDLLREAKVTFVQVYGPGHEMALLPDRLLAEVESLRSKAQGRPGPERS